MIHQRFKRGTILPGRNLSAFLAAAILLCMPSQFSPIRAGADSGLPPVHFNGAVVNVVEKNGNPVTFSLQLKARRIDVGIVRRTLFTALSAEAEVQGFQTGDYALVVAHRVRQTWVASKIYFDVRTIYALNQVTLSGSIYKAEPRRLALKVDRKIYWWIYVNKHTTFRINGQIVDGQPSLIKGNFAQVVARRAPGGWMAFELNLKV